ncbi:hypothetical protein PGT21_014627 [Puccinia graminis f. sp. tritici]|uniref:Uncharacterized protein n=1 Tax=Puccinia graminis f. sp. tritici TaxID=56615 RepID=A0A5B0LVF4_PUCGR|nr:hypothetical protein PGT21_014627 [Puccinia graminis f. sp. tritici]
MSSRYDGSPTGYLPNMGQSTAPIIPSGGPPPLFHPSSVGSMSPSSPPPHKPLILHRGLLPGELYSDYGYSNQDVDFAAHGVPPSIPHFVYYNLPPPSEPHPSALTTNNQLPAFNPTPAESAPSNTTGAHLTNSKVRNSTTSEISPSLPPPLSIFENTPSQTYSRPVLSSAPSHCTPSQTSRSCRPLPKIKAPRKANITRKKKTALTQTAINPQPSTPVPDPPPPAGPLADLHDRQSKKRKCLTTTDSNQPEAQSEEALLKLSEAQLAIQARKTSKRAMSDDDRDFFAEYQHYLRKLLIIRAIERGVSMPMVDGFLYKTKEARDIFRGHGVAKKNGMLEVSSKWHGLSDEEKLEFAKCVRSVGSNARPANTEGPGNNPDEVDDTDEIDAAGEVSMRQTVSLKRAADQVQNFMDDWVARAVHIAKTTNCEMVMFAVSRHLGSHAFQLAKWTHGATRFVTGSKALDGPKHYPARMQAYLTGYEVAQVAKINSKKGCAVKKHPVSISKRMAALIGWY